MRMYGSVNANHVKRKNISKLAMLLRHDYKPLVNKNTMFVHKLTPPRRLQ